MCDERVGTIVRLARIPMVGTIESGGRREVGGPPPVNVGYLQATGRRTGGDKEEGRW